MDASFDMVNMHASAFVKAAAAWDVAILETKIAFCWFMDLNRLKLVLGTDSNG